MVVVITEKSISAYSVGESSDYLLLDKSMKEVLSVDLGEPFDHLKHQIHLQVSLNKSGKRFVAFWFEKK